MGELYRTDLVLWAAQQAQALRSVGRERLNSPGNRSLVDWDNVAEEVESLGASERRTLASHIRTVVEHLMKLQASSAADPRDGWVETILRVRDDIADVLDTSPSLRRDVPDIIGRQTVRARRLVAHELGRRGEEARVALDALIYRDDQVLGPWLPEAPES